MAVPFDTLKLARQFEAAGFESKQAGDMAAAISEAVLSADLATSADVKNLGTALRGDMRELEQRLIIRLSAAMIVVAGVLFSALHYWPPAHG